MPQPRWLDDPEAAALLDDLARRPPRRREQRETYGATSESRLVFSGRRVGRLRRIRARYLELILAACDRARDYGAFRAECAVDVEEAIADRIDRARETPLAQHLRLRRSRPKEQKRAAA